MVTSVLRGLGGAFEEVYFRGDTAFYRIELIKLLAARPRTYFAFCVDSFPGLVARAEKLPKRAWKLLQRKRGEEGKREEPREERRKRRRCREEVAKARNYKNLRTTREWVAEFAYQPTGCTESYRRIVVRKKIEHTKGQLFLLEEYRYRFVITSIPRWSPAGVVAFTYKRCDQENILKELEEGLEGMRMPTGELLANEAFLLMAELAWNLRKWASLLVLPEESLRWQWKRFRQAFVYVATKVVETAGEVRVRFSRSHRHSLPLKEAVHRLEVLVPA
jgi:hypothetical protein